MYEFLNEYEINEELNIYQKNKAEWLVKTNRYSLNTKKTYWKLLNKYINPLEALKGKDLLYFDEVEIISALKCVPTKILSTTSSLYCVINIYINELSKKIIGISNPCDNIDINYIVKNKSKEVNNPYQDLQMFYDLILGLNCSEVDKAMLVLLRYGVTVDDIGYVKWEDIDRENMLIKISNENKKLKLPIDNLFIMVINQAKACNIYKPSQKTVEYVDFGYIIKATPTVKWKSIPPRNIYNKVGELSRRNNIERISVADLNMARSFDILLKKYYSEKIVNIEDLKNIIIMFDGELTQGKLSILRKNFELITGIYINQ
jgi:integrase